MPFANLRTSRVHYELDGPGDAPVIVLSHSLGADLAMWDAQIPELARRYRVLRYDTRGHGESSLPNGPHNVPSLGQDVLDLLDYLTVSVVSFCGLSLGALIGLWLARNAPKRIRKLVACSSAAKIGTLETWNARIDLAQREGMQAVVPGILERWFTPSFHASSPESVQAIRAVLDRIPTDGYIAGCAAVRDADLRDDLAGVAVPTLVITGTDDPVTPPADGRWVAERIPGASYLELPGAHLFTLESASNFHEHCFSSWTLLNCDTLVVAALYLHPLIENPMTFENILFETKNSIAYVTVNRPKALNALNMATMEDLYAAFTDIQDDSSIRTAILTGAGRKSFRRRRRHHRTSPAGCNFRQGLRPPRSINTEFHRKPGQSPSSPASTALPSAGVANSRWPARCGSRVTTPS